MGEENVTTTFGRGLGTVLMIVMAAAARAQGGGGLGSNASPARWNTAIECLQCTIHLTSAGSWAEFGTEPIIRGSSADGVFLDGDVIVAVDGRLITTAAGGTALAFAVQNTAQLTIRRNGKQFDVIVPQNIRWSTDASGRLVFASAKDSAVAVGKWRRDAEAAQAYLDGAASVNRSAGEPGVTAAQARLHVAQARIGAARVAPGGAGFQIGAFGFTGQPVYTITLPDGSVRTISNGGRDTTFTIPSDRRAGTRIGARRPVPDTFYLASAADTALDANDIRFLDVPVGGIVRIYTSTGILSRVLQNTQAAGAAVPWNLRNRSGQVVACGVYFYNVESGGASVTGRLMILPCANPWATGDTTFPVHFGRGSGTGIGAGRDTITGQRTGNVVMNDHGWLGFGLECRGCTTDTTTGSTRVLHFSSLPTVVGIDAGGPADRAGVLAGDVLRAIDGLQMTSADGVKHLGELKPGQRVQLTVDRKGKSIQLALTVGPAVH
jgi:hypothetical protein